MQLNCFSCYALITRQCMPGILFSSIFLSLAGIEHIRPGVYRAALPLFKQGRTAAKFPLDGSSSRLRLCCLPVSLRPKHESLKIRNQVTNKHFSIDILTKLGMMDILTFKKIYDGWMIPDIIVYKRVRLVF